MPNNSQNGNSISVRQAHASEAERISQLALRSKGHWGYTQDFLRQCAAELSYTTEQLSSPRYHFAVAKTGTEIVGFYGLHFDTDQTPELEALFVEADFIGKGVGKLLLQDAIAYARFLGADKLLIQSDPHASAFYQRNGGKLVGQLASHSIPGRSLPLFEINLC